MDILAENLHIIAIVLFVFYSLAGICAVREIMYGRTAQGSIAWLLSLAFFPIPTVFIYLIFGWKKFDDYPRLTQCEISTIQSTSGDVEGLAEPPIESSVSDKHFRVLTSVAPIPFQSGNKAKLLIDGQETFSSIFAGIKAAQHYVLVQFFIIRNDRLGKEMADLLIEKATQGVSVYLLYDNLGSKDLPRRYLRRLSDAGVQVAGFNQTHPMLRLTGPFRINFRNHRKIVVVDGECTWVGGHNVGVEYLGENPSLGRWRDTHVKVIGPATTATQLSFAEDWLWATGKSLPVRCENTGTANSTESVLVMPTGPADDIETCAVVFADLISRANDRVWIVSPYFVPGIEVITALYGALLRGVDVRVLLPSKPDHRIVWLASTSHAADMVAAGVKVYRYNDGFLHQKIFLVDDDLAGVGTVNFDNRSFRINFEVTMWFAESPIVADVEKMLIADFEQSVPVEEPNLYHKPYYFQVAARAARLLSPIL
ncbi:MAG: cardiolipin synthase [Stappiaceae bacterium]